MAEVISWEWAERTAAAVAGREPLSDSYHAETLESDFAEATEKAQELVEAETGLRSFAGEAHAKVTDRKGWTKANVTSFRRLLTPLTDRLANKVSLPFLAPATGIVAGVELGSLLGWMSTRVLGQYDLLLSEDTPTAASENGAAPARGELISAEPEDVVYFVGPNILALERRYGFPPKEFRLWIALHELTHRAQFTGISWMREYFSSLISETLTGMDPDPKVLLDRLAQVVGEIRKGENHFRNGGLLSLLASPEQRNLLEKVQGLMSLLEGHGDVTMDRAGADLVPNAGRFSSVLRERRASVSGPARLMQRALGLEAKMRQYEEGEHFVREIEVLGGPSLLSLAWQRQENLPTAAEIRSPYSWAERVGGIDHPDLFPLDLA